jgi:hypothetical protein
MSDPQSELFMMLKVLADDETEDDRDHYNWEGYLFASELQGGTDAST